ncbi:hypothetical protein ACFLXW_00565 [Candidatus Dependentiae bacterium]
MANEETSQETIDQSIKRQHWTPLRKKAVAVCALAGFVAAVSVKVFFNDEEDGSFFQPAVVLFQIPTLTVATYGLPECSFNKLYSRAHRQYDPRLEWQALDGTLTDIHYYKSDLIGRKYTLTNSQWQQLQNLEDHVARRMHSH